MDVYQVIQTRRSIRKYLDRPVEDDKLQRVLEAARLSPSAGNRQNWHFIVVRDVGLRARLTQEAIRQPFVGQAPLILVACSTAPESVIAHDQQNFMVDLSIATTFMILEAWELGLGTCLLGLFQEGLVKEILKIPQDVRVIAITPLGYPDETPAPRPRKELAEITSTDYYRP